MEKIGCILTSLLLEMFLFFGTKPRITSTNNTRNNNNNLNTVIFLGKLNKTMARHSNLQKQVLSLFKQFVRAGKEKPGFLPQIQVEFRKNAKIPKTDVMHIEFLLRRGRRQLEQLKESHTKQMGAFVKASPKKE